MRERARTDVPEPRDSRGAPSTDDDRGARADDAIEADDDREEAAEVEEAVEEALVEEVGEEEAGEEEAAIEAELEAQGPAGAGEDAVLDVLLRRSGVLPEDTEIAAHEEDTELPPPRRPDEFVCSSCFLVKPRRQMGDPARRVCRDCLDPPSADRPA